MRFTPTERGQHTETTQSAAGHGHPTARGAGRRLDPTRCAALARIVVDHDALLYRTKHHVPLNADLTPSWCAVSCGHDFCPGVIDCAYHQGYVVIAGLRRCGEYLPLPHRRPCIISALKKRNMSQHHDTQSGSVNRTTRVCSVVSCKSRVGRGERGALLAEPCHASRSRLIARSFPELCALAERLLERWPSD